MTATTDAQDQQRRIQELVYDWTNHEQVRAIAQRSGLSPRRTAGLFAVASVVGGSDTRCALQSAESAARWARGSAVEAVRRLHADLPVTSSRPRQQFGDGTLIRVTMQTWQASRSLLTGPPRVVHGTAVADVDRRERVASWTVDPTAQVYYRHQRDRHNADLGSVGRITAAEADATTRDLRVWIELTDPNLVEQAMFRELSASPGLAADSPMDRGWSAADQEHTRCWRQAHVVELSLVPYGMAALGGIAVELSPGPPATASTPTGRSTGSTSTIPAIRDWDEPRSARGGQVYPTGRTASGLTYSVRTFDLPPLQLH